MGALEFWSIATAMVVATTATIAVPLFWRTRSPATNNLESPPAAPRRTLVLALAVIVPLAVLGAYRFSGRPDLLGVAPDLAANDVATQHVRLAMRGGAQGGDLDAAIERLRARLAANPADAAGWRLLAQSYEFQGRSAEAAAANKQADAAGAGATSPVSAAPPLDSDAAQLAQSAQEHRRRREFPAAVEAFAALAKRGAMSADLWADYADALGGARGGLDQEAATIIATALRLEPDHVKALWLQGSWQTQRGDYAAALATWQHLTKLLPADSPDARIIAGNLEEARQKSGGTISALAAQAPAIGLRGSVRLDPRWAKRVGPNDVLFVFARAADERGPPLAVLRINAGPWPIQFALDDRNAMMPDRKLSDFTRVILEARISRSGNALAQAGDLRAVSAVLNPREAQRQELIISEEVAADKPAQGG